MHRILFVCNGNSGRSLIAGEFAKRIAPDGVEIISACDNDIKTHPLAKEVMKEIGMTLPPEALKMEDVVDEVYDVVVTLCIHLQESCPHFPGSPARVHWGLMDPTIFEKNPEEQKNQFRRVRDEIEKRVFAFFEHGYLDGFIDIRSTFSQMLNTMTDGVLAHDSNRRVFFINHAAEDIMGVRVQDVIGKDCHSIFPGPFCGKNCAFCEKGMGIDKPVRFQSKFKRPDKDTRDLEVSAVPLISEETKNDGALIVFRDMTELTQLRNRIEEGKGFHGIVGKHPSMQRLYSTITDLAKVNIPVLIQGESGTGKEMVAKALHTLSDRDEAPFVPVDCGALPEGILESELFGHVKGAFTSAIRDKKGRFEMANGGVIFLDEIGEMPLSIQVKLLRAIQEKSFVPVGSEKTVHVDVRIVCATNKDLKTLTNKGLFREDLYYRLAVVPLQLPPLRERKMDVPFLVDHFQEQFARENNIQRKPFAPEALDHIISYRWPGNVRELANAIQYSMIKCNESIIRSEHLPMEITVSHKINHISRRGRRPKLSAIDVEKAMQRASGNKVLAAKMLGVSRTTLYRYLDEV